MLRKQRKLQKAQGRSVAKWGGIPFSQDLILFDPGIMEYVTSAAKWRRYIKYAHCLNCWKVMSDEQKVPVPKVHRTTVIRKAVDQLQTLNGTQVNNLRIGGISNLQFLAQSDPGCICFLRMSAVIVTMCICVCVFAGSARSSPRGHACVPIPSCTMPRLPRVCTIYVICVRDSNSIHPSIHPSAIL